MVELLTEHLLLREFKKTDWKAVHEYAADAEVCKFMEWGPNSADDTVAFVDSVLEFQRQKPRRQYELAVILSNEQKLIGAAAIRLIDPANGTAELGYCYNRHYWRRGFASEVCRRLIQHGFEDLKLHRILATCDSENVGSARVLSGCGMRQEAHFVKDKNVKGRWRDALLFAILEEDWRTPA